MAAPPILAASTVLFIIRWRINLLAMGDEEARALGVDTKRITQTIVLCATVITASAVCISGIIGWVGLVVPHMGRLLVGPDFRKLVPASALIGAVFLLAVDNLSRVVFPTEIPPGNPDGPHGSAGLCLASGKEKGGMAVMLQVQNAAFAYKQGTPVFHNISFALAQGEILSVLGRNGIGKSTLIRCLLGLMPLCEGRVLLAGKDISRLNRTRTAALVGYVPQAGQVVFSVLRL